MKKKKINFERGKGCWNSEVSVSLFDLLYEDCIQYKYDLMKLVSEKVT